MPPEDKIPSSTEAIRKRAEEMAGLGKELTGEAEMLAALADASLSFEEIDDVVLERCVAEFGTEAVIEALIGASELTREAVNEAVPFETGKAVVQRRGYGAWLRRWRGMFAGVPGGRLAWAGSAAAIVIVGVLVFYETGRKAGQSPIAPGSAKTEKSFKLQWPSRDPFDPSTLRIWSAPNSTLAEAVPDFKKGATTLGAGGNDRFEPWRMASVIVRSGNAWNDGWGSGTLVSGDGWILSSYHVVVDAAQQAAISGRLAEVDVITARMVDGRIEPRATLKATLFRADPAQDLALLKINSLPAGEKAVPFFQFGTRVRAGEDCFVVGSESNGPAWWIRSGNVSGSRSHLSGSSYPGGAFEREQTDLIATDIRVSPGDSGGPLLNAEGKLIGLTLVPSGSGGEGRHVALRELVEFTRDLPTQPEGVPFDAWIAGLPGVGMLEPELADSSHRGNPDALVYRYASKSTVGANPSSLKAKAVTVFADLSGRKVNAADSTVLIPFGLWGMEDRGGFRFDVFVTLRSDHVMAVGYTDGDGVVDEIRVGRSEDRAEVIWTRRADGKWYVVKAASSLPLIEPARLGKDRTAQLEVILGHLLTVDVAR